MVGDKVKNTTELIEDYLKRVIQKSEENIIEVKRTELAELFQCVPSQINYVINTRFTYERGYVVESKRGGGGFIRIIKLEELNKFDTLDEMIRNINSQLTQLHAQHYILRLHETNVITDREARMMLNAVDRSTLGLELPYRDLMRARILKSMLIGLRH